MRISRNLVVVGAALALSGIVAGPVAAAPPTGAQGCPLEPGEPAHVYSITTVKKSVRPTSLYSAYITGPGTISYSKTTATNVAASLSASATAEAGVVLAKASTTIGVSLTAGRTWTDGFSYALEVPKGQRRRLRLFQESRSFKATKKTWHPGKCTYVPSWQNQPVNAPRTQRVDEWRLQK